MSEAPERPVPATPAVTRTLSGQVSRAMLWNAILQPARLIAGFISGLVVLNLLTKDEYGTIATLSAMAATFGLIADIGVERGLVKFLPEIEARYGRDGVRYTLWLVIWQKVLVLALVIGVAIAFHGWFFASWRSGIRETNVLAIFDRYRWVLFAAMMALVIFGAIFDVYMQALVSYFRQRAWNVISLIVTILKPLLLIGVVLAGWGILGVVGVIVAIPIVATLLAFWQATTLRRALIERPTQTAAGARLVPRFLAYCGLSFWIQLTEYAYSLDFVVLLLAPVSAASAAGLKAAFSLVSQALSALWSPLVGVQIPLFARLYARNDDRQLGEAYAILSKFLAAILFPAAIGLLLLIGNVMAAVYPQYSEFATAARILGFCLCIDAALSVPLAILMAYERFRPMLIARSCALVAVPLLYLVIPHYGVVGAALVMGGTRLACDGLAMIFALRQLPLRYPWRFAGRVLAAACAMAAVVAPLALLVLRPEAEMDTPTRVLFLTGNLVLGVVGGLIYLGAFRLTGGLDPADRQRIRELKLPATSLVLRFI